MGASASNPFTTCTKHHHHHHHHATTTRTKAVMDVDQATTSSSPFLQNVIVMRHGDRLDSAQPMWAVRADRPWDTPLAEVGKVRAWATGKRLRNVGFPIHRVVMSPFLRCLQTAAEVVRAICAVEDDGGLMLKESSEGVEIDPARVKVCIEYGLCEVICGQTIHPNLAPKKGKWFPDICELEAVLPVGTIDHSTKSIRKRLPQWEESVEDARSRYEKVILALAQRFPHENLLLVTHGEGVGVSISSFLKDMYVSDVDYCGYTHLQREVSSNSSQACTAGAFKVLTRNGQTGISYSTLS